LGPKGQLLLHCLWFAVVIALHFYLLHAYSTNALVTASFPSSARLLMEQIELSYEAYRTVLWSR